MKLLLSSRPVAPGYRRIRHKSGRTATNEGGGGGGGGTSDGDNILPRANFARSLESLAQQANPWFPDALEGEIQRDGYGETSDERMYVEYGECQLSPLRSRRAVAVVVPTGRSAFTT